MLRYLTCNVLTLLSTRLSTRSKKCIRPHRIWLGANGDAPRVCRQEVCPLSPFGGRSSSLRAVTYLQSYAYVPYCLNTRNTLNILNQKRAEKHRVEQSWLFVDAKYLLQWTTGGLGALFHKAMEHSGSRGTRGTRGLPVRTMCLYAWGFECILVIVPASGWIVGIEFLSPTLFSSRLLSCGPGPTTTVSPPTVQYYMSYFGGGALSYHPRCRPSACNVHYFTILLILKNQRQSKRILLVIPASYFPLYAVCKQIKRLMLRTNRIFHSKHLVTNPPLQAGLGLFFSEQHKRVILELLFCPTLNFFILSVKISPVQNALCDGTKVSVVLLTNKETCIGSWLVPGCISL